MSVIRNKQPQRKPGITNKRSIVGINAAVRFALSTFPPGSPTAVAAESVTNQHQMGHKYSPLTQINTTNVENLQLANSVGFTIRSRSAGDTQVPPNIRVGG